MNLIISLVYAPIVIYLLNNFDTKSTAIYIAIFTFIWLLINVIKKLKKELFLPLIYLFVSIIAYNLDSSFTLKFTPFLISFLVSGFIFYSYLVKNSFIFIFLDKFKIKIKQKEKEYIEKSTLFWFLFSIINTTIHGLILYINDETYWIFYSSIGWYFIFLIAGVLQFFHRKISFSKGMD